MKNCRLGKRTGKGHWSRVLVGTKGRLVPEMYFVGISTYVCAVCVGWYMQDNVPSLPHPLSTKSTVAYSVPHSLSLLLLNIQF